mmetsp:Transcript_128876/g.334127  ORF Transcript_128876/g.334127 Transcript_128876/m.334127 type:complete len:282 (+) Transcript_128876:67-912(+)
MDSLQGLPVPATTQDAAVGGLLPVVVAARCAQHADIWLGASKALEGIDLEVTRTAVQTLRAAVANMQPLLQAVEVELQRREDFHQQQIKAREAIEHAMATVKKDVGALGDALACGMAAQLNTEELALLVNAIVDEERRETSRRALHSAVNPLEGVPSGPALRSAIALAQASNLADEELRPAFRALAEDERRSAARQALADALVPPPSARSLDAIGAALETARGAGVSDEELGAAEEALREGAKSSIWYDIISIIADDEPATGKAGSALAGLVALPEEAPAA